LEEGLNIGKGRKAVRKRRKESKRKVKLVGTDVKICIGRKAGRGRRKKLVGLVKGAQV
jgi:hypothetical protein